MQFDTRYNVVENNVIYANAQNLFFANYFSQNTGNVVDYNIYNSPGGANGSTWIWMKKAYSSFSAWQSGTGSDAYGAFVDPLLVDPASGDLHIQATSPAINAGDTLPSDVIGTQDIDGDARVSGGFVDAGADERQ